MTVTCEWVNGSANGKGKCILANGDSYEGEIADSRANGYGIY